MRYCITTLSLLLLSCHVGLPVLSANDGQLSRQMDQLAASVRPLLEKRASSSLQIGRLSGPYHTPTGYGAALRAALADALDKAGVDVAHRADVIISGKFVETRHGDDVTGIKASFWLHDPADEQLETLPDVTLRGSEYTAHALGVTAVVPVDAGASHPSSDTPAEKIDTPRFYQTGSRISASAEHAFCLEVLLRQQDEFKPLTPVNEEDWAFVTLHPGDVYAIRLTNNSSRDAAVDLRVDGLSVFHYSELRNDDGTPRYSHIVVAAGKSHLIRGWHSTNDKSHAFLTEVYFAGSEADLPVAESVGVISATFANAWKKGDRPPSDELAQMRSPLQTRLGHAVDARFDEAPRIIGRQRASIAIRYARD